MRPVRAREEHDSNAEDVGGRDARGVRRRDLQDEFETPGVRRWQENCVQFLVERLVLGAANVDDLPFDVCQERKDKAALVGQWPFAASS